MTFPTNFLWGVSSSGFQFEMGDSAGKNVDSNTDWYVWVHDSSNIRKGIVSGDLPEKGIDYWSLYKQDHAIAKQLGLNAYRIGVEWSRVFPTSTSAVEVRVEKASDGTIVKIDVDQSALERLDTLANRGAVRHYRDVIEDLRDNGLEVFLCLNHFTLPLWIHDPITARKTRLRRGPKGWVDENTIDAFRVFKRVAMHLVVAHARSYDVIKKLCSAANVGVINNVIPVMPLSSEKKSDVKAAEYLNMMHNLFFIQAVSKGWLDENLNEVKEKGEIEDYLGNRLDWLGVNYYSRLVVKGRSFMLAKYIAGTSVIPSVVPDYGFTCQPYSRSADGLPTSGIGWELYPEGLLAALKAMKAFGKPIYVTENGISDVKDVLRSSFLVEHLKVLERAISEEGIDVRGYFHWSLTDNYEWAKGFGQKFGLYSIDLETKSRKVRKSAEVLKGIVKKVKAEES
jgi:beta-galactosidase